MEDELAIDVTKLAHAWHSSAAASDPWDTSGKTFETHRKGADAAYRAVGKMSLPWYKRWDLYDADKLNAMVEAFYAQEKDPEFVRKRNELKKKMTAEIEEMVSGERAVREGRIASRKYADDLRKRGLKRGNKRRT